MGPSRHGRATELHGYVDEGSRYRAARILTKGKAQAPNAALCLNFLNEGWIQHFGKPKTLRLDPAGSFRASSVERFCDRHGIYLDIIPGEAHWQIGVAEQATQGLKQLMTKTVQADKEATADELLSLAVSVFNQRELVSGFSPVHGPILNRALEEFQREANLRSEAEKALAEWNAQQRIQYTASSELQVPSRMRLSSRGSCLLWRTQASNKSKKHPGTN